MPSFAAMQSTVRLMRTLIPIGVALILVALIPSAANASGCTDSWSAKTSGSWFTAGNWSTGKVPTSTDEVCITDNGTASYTVELKQTGANVTVKALTIGGTANTQTLAVESSSSANAVLTTEAGITNGSHGVVVMTNGDGAGNSVTISGPVSNAGTIEAQAGVGGARTIQGNVTNTGTLAINANTSYNGSKATLTNEGAVTIGAGDTLTASAETTFLNGSGGKITTTGSGLVLMEPGTTFNQGAGTTSGTKPVVVRDAALHYTGSGASLITQHGESGSLSGNISAGQTLVIESTSGEHGKSTAAASFSNAGTITLTNGDGSGNNATLTMTSPATLSSSGAINVEAGVGGARTIQGNVTNTGTLAINTNTSYNGSKATLTNEGAVTIANEKQLTVSNEGAVVNGTGGSITATGNGDLLMEPGTSFTQGAGTTSGTKPVVVRDAALHYTGSGASLITQHGESGSLSGNISAGQTLVIESTSGEHGKSTAAASFSNAGTITLTNGDGSGNNATLAVSAGTLSNSGSIKVEAGVGGARTIQGNVTNTGTLAINTNTSYNGSKATLTNEGAVTIANEKQLTVSNEGAVVNGTGGSITATGNGDLLMEPGTSFTEGAGTTSGTKPVIVRNAALHYTGSGASSMFVHGESTTLSGNIAAGQALTIESTTGEHGRAIAAGSFSSAGTITLTNGDGSGNNATILVSAGTFTNSGTIDVEKGVGGARNIQGNVTNTGTINLNANTNYNASAVTFTNEGPINIATGVQLSVTGKSTVSNEAGGNIVVTGTGALVEIEGTFNEGLGKTSTAKAANPVVLDRVAVHYTAAGASKIEAEGSNSLSGTVGKGQTLILQSTTGEHDETSAGSFAVVGKLILTNGDGAGNNVTLKLAGGTLQDKGTVEALWPHGGVRTIEGSLVNEKTLAIGNNSSQALKVTGSFTQTAKGQLKDTIAGATNFGRLSVTGAVALNHKLALKQSKFTGKTGETFAIISGASRTGEFTEVTGNAIKNTTLHYIPHYTASGVNLVVE